MTRPLCLLGLGATLALPLSALPAQPQNCSSLNPRSAPVERYLPRSDGTVTDRYTGLMWKRCAEGQTWKAELGECEGRPAELGWQDALLSAETSNSIGYAGFRDWRLPNFKELDSLIETACYTPAVNIEIFPRAPRLYFWSSSPYATDHGFAWAVGFDYGESLIGRKTKSYAVRLVRGGF